VDEMQRVDAGSSTTFGVGDRVRLRDGLSSLRREADANIQRLRGVVGVITSFDSDGDVRATFLGEERMCFPPCELELAPPQSTASAAASSDGGVRYQRIWGHVLNRWWL